jgi:hypothetical protein
MCERSPADPLQRHAPLQTLARNAHPVLVVLDVEAHPQSGKPIALESEARGLAELSTHHAVDEVHQRRIRRRHDLFARLRGIDLDLFALRQFLQQLAAPVGLRGHQRGTGEVHHAHHVLRDLARTRLLLVGAEYQEPARRRGEREQRQEHKGAPQERARPEPDEPRPLHGSARVRKKS